MAALAGIATAAQVVVNTLGIRTLDVGALIGVSSLTAAAAGFAARFFSGPEVIGGAVLYALVSGLLGPAVADFGFVKILGVALIRAGGLLVVKF